MFGVVKIALAAMAAVNVSATKNWSLYDWRIESFLETSARIIATPVSDPSNGHFTLAASSCGFSGLIATEYSPLVFQALPSSFILCGILLVLERRKIGTPKKEVLKHILKAEVVDDGL